MMEMKIKEELVKLEKRENIQVLYACESGSRGWGFPSSDSDYDVRFIYIRPVEWYLSIESRKNCMGLPFFGELDLGGWDIRRTLKMLQKSNATVFEWLQSPIVYMKKADFRERMVELCNEYFCPRSTMIHYLGMVNNFLKHCNKDVEIKIKQYFYILRPLFAAKWIADRKEMPPMEFNVLRSIFDGPTELQDEIDILIKKKKGALETSKIMLVPTIQKFVAEEYNKCISQVEKFHYNKKESFKLDEFFRECLAYAPNNQ